MTKPVLLQLCPFSNALEQGLAQLFSVHKFYAEPAPEAWLDINAYRVQAVATGGHIGIPNSLMLRLPALGIVAVNGVGLDKIDLDLARRRNVRVTTTPNALTDDVADLAVGLVIALLRDIVYADAFVRDHLWSDGDKRLARKVTGRRFGIVGLGQIGQAIAKRLSAFGDVAYTDLMDKGVAFRFIPRLLDLAHESNVLILASSANERTRNLITDAVLEALGPDGVLVNVARGSLVDEQALISALKEGRVGGAALDVFANEPCVPRELMQLPNVILTPHVASATVETRDQMARIVLANLADFFAGRPLTAAVV